MLPIFFILLLLISYFTLIERQMIAGIQRRQGPNVVGVFGLLQPIADGLKLIVKELVIPIQADTFYYICAPFIVFICTFLQWYQIPIGIKGHYSIIGINNLALLFLAAFSALASIGVFLAGWASNSKYALLGALRSIAQIVSYELAMTTIFLILAAYTGTINLFEYLSIQIQTIYLGVPLLPIAVIFFILTVAETNRAPMDLPEGESEIVAGFFVEYSAIMFALFFLGEYSKILAVSAINILIFFGEWSIFSFAYLVQLFFLIIKILLNSYLFILIRAALPRYRIDQLMTLGWIMYLPLLFIILIFIFIFMQFFNPCF
jgi:NADH-quinone oxidoreductase subunit H